MADGPDTSSAGLEGAPEGVPDGAPEGFTLEEMPGTLVVYANLCAIQITPEEVMFHFAERDFSQPLVGRSVVRVFTSLGHAKRLALALNRTLERHEKRYGPISAQPMPVISAANVEEDIEGDPIGGSND